MLLPSPGDNGSSLPVDSLQPLLPDSSLVGQTSLEGDRVTATSSLDTLVEDHRAPSQTKEALSSSGIRPHADDSARPVGIHTTKEPSPVTQQPLRQAAWSTPPSQERDLDGLYALRQAATFEAMRQSRSRSWSRGSLAALADVSAAEMVDRCSFAAPLSPLRERDLTALSEFFVRHDMPAIEADINQRLLSLLPEPCWEEDVFDFLKEFL